MKMKKYCLQVLHDFIKRDLITVIYRGETALFSYKNLQPSCYGYYECFGVKMYVGNGITMFGMDKYDVISFEKNGNILCFNIKDVLKEYNH